MIGHGTAKAQIDATVPVLTAVNKRRKGAIIGRQRIIRLGLSVKCLPSQGAIT